MRRPGPAPRRPGRPRIRTAVALAAALALAAACSDVTNPGGGATVDAARLTVNGVTHRVTAAGGASPSPIIVGGTNAVEVVWFAPDGEPVNAGGSLDLARLGGGASFAATGARTGTLTVPVGAGTFDGELRLVRNGSVVFAADLAFRR